MPIQLRTHAPVSVVSGSVAVPLETEEIWVTSVTIQASFSNVSKLNVGDSSVTPSNGQEIPPGDSCIIEGSNSPRHGAEEFALSQVYITSSTAGDSCRVISFRRRP